MTNAQTHPLDDAAFAQIAATLYHESGIVLAAHKKDMVYSRLQRRLRELQLTDFKAYCEWLSRNHDEIGFLVNSLTTNLTSFFREAHHFEHLRQQLIEPLMANPPPRKRLRIWSAGCSKGAEAYSIAMVLAGGLQGQHGWNAKILATDIDTQMIAHAIEGRYQPDEMKSVPPSYLRYVQQHNDNALMSESLRQLITFKPLNLLQDWPMKGQFDAIFCRNVVIYFDKPTQQALFARFRRHLAPHGFLYVGHSESLAQVSNDFKLVGKTIYRPC